MRAQHMNNDALIGYSGYVGQALLRQRTFGHLFRSSNIADIRGGSFEMVVCAGAPAQKWIANGNPEQDLENLESLMSELATVTCRRFVLISTVDVFSDPAGADEDTPVIEQDLSAYGRNRRLLELFVERTFPECLIVRLPGLVGPGLRKNVVFDLLNNNALESVDSRGVFQFYPMVNLWSDISVALSEEFKLIHLTAAPIQVEEVAKFGFGVDFVNHLSKAPASYDFRTKHAVTFGGSGSYQYSRRESLIAIRAYAQSEHSDNRSHQEAVK